MTQRPPVLYTLAKRLSVWYRWTHKGRVIAGDEFTVGLAHIHNDRLNIGYPSRLELRSAAIRTLRFEHVRRVLGWPYPNEVKTGKA